MVLEHLVLRGTITFEGIEMIDTKELRRLAQAATPGPDGVSLSWVRLLRDFQQGASPAAISELLDRLEEAESDALEQARLNGMGASREAALMAKLEAAEKERDVLRDRLALESQENGALRDSVDRACEERDALRAKVEAMEKQEPVWFIDERGEPKRYHKSKADYCKYGGLDLLYSLPGAKGE